NPIGFGSCMYNLSYSWAILNSKKDTVFKSTQGTPRFNFTKEDLYTVTLTVKTVPGGYCAANTTRTASSVLKVAKEGGKDGAPAPNMYSANTLGTLISAYAMDDKGQVISGPYDHFDPFPADNAVTAALSMDDKGNYFYLPTFMRGNTAIKQGGVVEIWAVDKKVSNQPVVIARFDMNGSSTTELGLFRMGLDQKGNAWILAGDGANMYAATFKTNGTKVMNTSDIQAFPVPFENGSAADFESGDLAFDNKGNMYVLAGSSTGTNIYTMSTNTSSPRLTKRWKVADANGNNFGMSVTGTVFDAKGNMYFSALDGIYYIDDEAVSAVTATATVKKVSENFGLMDLATSQFPAAWVAPFDGVVLPVKLIRFSGAVTGEKAHLSWKVASNETGSHFELERSHDGHRFKTQMVVFNTEKPGEATYQFADAAPLSGKAYYRLKIVNQNRSETYSNVVFLESGAMQGAAITLLQNPVHSAVTFHYAAAENTQAQISVYTISGIKVLMQKHNLQKGSNSISIPLNPVQQKGMYILEVKS
ncbi:MAG TPA: T9SS type A sorting domain-containing protein, partial [Chitinophagaceae bacterium]|nr:T9SS type A sorting domain-containing protein [Chitinophagaceae bacterium]